MDNNPNKQTKPPRRPGNNPRKASQPGGSPLSVPGATQSRGAAVRAQRRSQADAQKIANQYSAANPQQVESVQRRANFIDDSPSLKVIGLGGLDGGGSKNMILVEYANDAIVMDCGNDLG